MRMIAPRSGRLDLFPYLKALLFVTAAQLERPVALDQDALHDALLAHRIVDIDPMHGGTIVPDHRVTHGPLVGVVELGLAAVRGQLGLSEAERKN